MFEIEVKPVFLLKNKKINLRINYLVFLDCFDVLMSKINLYKKHYFDAFSSEKHFKKQLLPHS
jgi:hypothetical protein